MGETKTAFGADRGKPVLKFDPDDLRIELDPTKPLYQRRGTEPPDPAIVASIKAHGVLQPVLVVRGDDGDPYVVDGTRRTIAACAANRELKAAGLPTKQIPAIYRDEKGAEGLIVKIVTNAQRKDLSITARAEEARLALAQGYSEDQVAGWFGVSAGTIKAWAEIPHLHPTVQKALDAGTVRVVDAVRTVGKLPKAEQPAALSKIETDRPTRAARKASGEKPNGKRPPTPSRRLKQVEAFVDEHPGSMHPSVLMFVAWLGGGVKDAQLVATFPDLAGMFNAKNSKRKEKH